MRVEAYGIEQTMACAAELAKAIGPGTVICLDGELGAGKTAFVRGLARALHYDGYVSSPTFTLINEYMADLPIYHFDVYRIQDPDELFDIGLDDYLFGSGVCVIEWAAYIRSVLPEGCIDVTIARDDKKGEDYRVITITGGGLS